MAAQLLCAVLHTRATHPRAPAQCTAHMALVFAHLWSRTSHRMPRSSLHTVRHAVHSSTFELLSFPMPASKPSYKPAFPCPCTAWLWYTATPFSFSQPPAFSHSISSPYPFFLLPAQQHRRYWSILARLPAQLFPVLSLPLTGLSHPSEVSSALNSRPHEPRLAAPSCHTRTSASLAAPLALPAFNKCLWSIQSRSLRFPSLSSNASTPSPSSNRPSMAGRRPTISWTAARLPPASYKTKC